MIIDTTINIDMGVLRDLEEASRITGICKHDLVSSLLKRLSREHMNMVCSWKRVKYQDRGGAHTWKCLHLLLWPDEYEFFLDLRKLFKMSVSYLIAYAVGRYLHDVVRSLLKRPDNNRYKNYMIISRVVDGIVCYAYYWGIPRTLPDSP